MLRYGLIWDARFSNDCSILFNGVAIHAANIPSPKECMRRGQRSFPRRSFWWFLGPHPEGKNCRVFRAVVAAPENLRYIGLRKNPKGMVHQLNLTEKTAQGLCPIEVASARFGAGWLL